MLKKERSPFLLPVRNVKAANKYLFYINADKPNKKQCYNKINNIF